jgi:hypothetical protein
MCLWPEGTPRPVNHDGCEPVEVVATGRNMGALLAAPALVAALVFATSGVTGKTVPLPSTGIMLAVVVATAVAVLGVGVGVLRGLPKAPVTASVALLPAERVRSLAAGTLTAYAEIHGYTPSPAVVQAMLPPLATFQPLALAAAQDHAAFLVADIVNAQAVRVGSIHRVAPSDVRQLVGAVW